MAGSRVTDFHNHEHEEPVTTELLKKVPNVPEVCNVVQKCQLDPSNQSKNSNMLSKTGNVTHTDDINLLSQENQDYDNEHDQQLMTCKHDGGQRYHNQSDSQSISHKHNSDIEQGNTELEPNSVLEEKEEWFYQWAVNYDVWNNNSFIPTKGNEMEGSHQFNGNTSVFNLTKTKYNGKLKTRIVGEISTSNKSEFYIGERQS